MLAVHGACLPSYDSLLSRSEQNAPAKVNLVLAPYVDIEDSPELKQYATKVANIVRLEVRDFSGGETELSPGALDHTVMAVGGGTFLDQMKLICHDRNQPMVAVGSNVSSDVAGSPLVSRHGAITQRVVHYGGAIDLALARGTSISSRLAGVGDLLSNIVALRDWTNSPSWTSSPRYLEAARLSARSVEQFLCGTRIDLSTDAGVDALASCLLESGKAMEVAGCSAPASGGCHRVGRALQHLCGPRHRHGDLALMGAVVVDELWNRSTGTSLTVRHSAERFGINVNALFAELTRHDFQRAIALARTSRLDRWSILDEYNSTDCIFHAVEHTTWFRALQEECVHNTVVQVKGH